MPRGPQPDGRSLKPQPLKHRSEGSTHRGSSYQQSEFMIGIYKITNLITNQVYVGQSIHIEERWEQHKREAKTDKNQAKLYVAMRKYGVENFTFEVIEQCEPNNNILNEREKYWISYYNSFETGYNMTRGGQGSDGWIFDPSEFKKLWDEGYTTKQIADQLGCCTQLVNSRLKGYKDYGRVSGHTRAYHAQMSLSVTPNKYIYQYTLLGEYIQQYNSAKEAAKALKVPNAHVISNCIKGKIKTAYGYQWKNEKYEKIPPVPSPNGKLVICIETGELFPDTGSAALAYKISSSTNIIRACKTHASAGKHPITKEKLHWKYYNSQENSN